MSVSAIQGVLTINFRVAFYHYKLSLICLVILPSLSDQNSKIDWIFLLLLFGWLGFLFVYLVVSVSWFSLTWFVLYAFLFYFLLNQGLST